MVSRCLRLCARWRLASGMSRRRNHGSGIHLGGARNRRRAHRTWNCRGTRSSVDGEAPRTEHPARSVHFKQRVHGRGAVSGTAPGAQALRCRSADHFNTDDPSFFRTSLTRNMSWHAMCSVCRLKNWQPTAFATRLDWGARLPAQPRQQACRRVPLHTGIREVIVVRPNRDLEVNR